MTFSTRPTEHGTDYSPDDHAAAVDAALGFSEPDAPPPATNAPDVAEQMHQFAAWLAPFRLSPAAVQAAGVRTLALCWMANAGPCRGLSQRAVADMIGVSRATVSHACIEIKKATGIRARGMRSDAAVAAYTALMTTRWHSRRGNDRKERRALAALKTEPAAAAWLDTIKRQQRRRLLVEVGRLKMAPLMHGALRQLGEQRPCRHADALRIVRTHAAPKKTISTAETSGLAVTH